MALTLSRHLLAPMEGTTIQAALDSALSKATAALRKRVREEARAILRQRSR